MTEFSPERKLAAIVAADVVGYSRLMGADEAGTHARLKALREQIIEPQIAAYHGRIVKLMGDGILAEFPSVVDALACAVEVQRAVAARNADIPDDQRIVFRIGINLGDVIVEGDDIYGDGVNIAARLEPLAEPGGICISQMARDGVSNKLPLDYADMGEQRVKNIAEPVRAYRVPIPTNAVMPLGSGGEPSQVSESTAETPHQKPLRQIGRWASLAAVIVILLSGSAVLWYQPWVPREAPALEARMALPLPDRPSIAVLPLMNLSDNNEQEYFADGITNDIITDLSQFSTLFVVAANSTFRYKGKPVKVQQVAEDLGVHYVLEGSVQRMGDTLRINTQLIDALSGHHVWAERYDRNANDLFAIQNEITRSVVGVISPIAQGRGKLVKAELERVARTRADNLSAYEHFLKAMMYIEHWDKVNNERSRQEFKKAIALDPGFGRAYGKHTWNYLADYRNGWSDDPEASLQQALSIATQGVAVDPNEPWTRFGLASVYLIMKRHDLALQNYEKAYLMNPNDADIIVDYGWCLAWAGRPDEGLPLVEKAMRLNPYHPQWYWTVVWLAHFVAERYQNAISSLEKITDPYPSVYRRLAATYALLDQAEEAQAAMAKYRELEPQNTIEQAAATFPFKRSEDLERLLNGLRKAGMPEKPPPPLPEKPSIAVLPFENMSSDSEQDYFGDGIAEDLITDLSKLRGLFVIARNSSFIYKGKSVDVRQIGRELGVRHVLEGSVRKIGEQVRITAQLIDATTGDHLWAQRYDEPLVDIFSLQDDIRQKIVASLDVQMSEGDQARVWRRTTTNANAYELFLEARELHVSLNKESIYRSIALLEQAIELDPEFAAAWTWLGWNYSTLGGWVETPDEKANVKAQALDYANRAIALDPSMGDPHAVKSDVYSSLDNPDRALDEARRAVELSPNSAKNTALLAAMLIGVDKPKEALTMIRKAVRLNPHPPDWYFFVMGKAYLLDSQFEEAKPLLQKCAAQLPGWVNCHYTLTLVYMELGQEKEAQDEAQILLQLNPACTSTTRLSFVHPSIREHHKALLIKAGLPE